MQRIKVAVWCPHCSKPHQIKGADGAAWIGYPCDGADRHPGRRVHFCYSGKDRPGGSRREVDHSTAWKSAGGATAHKLKHVVLLTTAYGRPFFGKGLRKLHVGGDEESWTARHVCAARLRKAAAGRLAEAGYTTTEIAAITGHISLSEIENYTRKADQVRPTRAAIAKQGGNESGKSHPGKWQTTRKAPANKGFSADMALPRGICGRRWKTLFSLTNSNHPPRP